LFCGVAFAQVLSDAVRSVEGSVETSPSSLASSRSASARIDADELDAWLAAGRLHVIHPGNPDGSTRVPTAELERLLEPKENT
jgi:hypothetical protein